MLTKRSSPARMDSFDDHQSVLPSQASQDSRGSISFPTSSIERTSRSPEALRAEETAPDPPVDVPVHESPSLQSKKSTRRRSTSRNSTTRSPNEDDNGLARLLAGLGDADCCELFEVTAGGVVRKLNMVPDQTTLVKHKGNFIIRRQTTHQKAHEAEQASGGTTAGASPFF